MKLSVIVTKEKQKT